MKSHQNEKSAPETDLYRRQVRPLSWTADRQIPVPNGKLVVSEGRPTSRRGLSRVEAAFYIGISPSKFDEMVRDGRMCSPKRIDARVVWDIRQIDAAFEKLPSDEAHDDDVNSWDDP
jgi:predicted DNA-binding transcriptional regulator AlpA